MVSDFVTHFRATQKLESVERKNTQKRVESILRMSENEQTGNSCWAVTGTRPHQVHWWQEWEPVEGDYFDSQTACATLDRSQVIVGSHFPDALRMEHELWRFLCPECCTYFLKSGLDPK